MKLMKEIKRELKERMMFQSELAEKMKGNTKTRIKDLSEILSGKREPGTQLLEEVAEAMGCEWKLVRKDTMMVDYLIFAPNTFEGVGIYQVESYRDGKPDFQTRWFHRDLDHIRVQLAKKGMTMVEKGIYDHESIIEVWRGNEQSKLSLL